MREHKSAESMKECNNNVLYLHHLWVQKVQTTSIITRRVKVFLPHLGITNTQSTFTEKEMAFIGSCHYGNILRQKAQTNLKDDSKRATKNRSIPCLVDFVLLDMN